jgi:aminoglycoside phosphotransferase (APT) family kinase protein
MTERTQLLSQELLELLREHLGEPALALDGDPVRLSGGFWAELLAFRLTPAPGTWDQPLVARVMPDPATAAKETAFQAGVAELGYPTPRVVLSGGPDVGIDGKAFLVMPLAAGAPLIGGLDGIRALLRLPMLARGLPATLAVAMAELHFLAPDPVLARLDAAEVPVPRLGPMLEHLRATVTTLDRDDLVAAASWLIAHRPPAEPEVVCHGDLHPFNVLGDGTTWTVLDWSAGLIAPAAYDVAFTSLVLAVPPLVLPKPFRPLVRGAGAALSRRFLRTYARSTGREVAPASLRWHQGVICLRALTEVAGWSASGTLAERQGHPWVIAGAAFAARLGELTGAPVRPS